WSRSPTSGCFQTADGLLMVAANNTRQIIPLLETLGLTALAEKTKRDPAATKDELNGLRPALEAALLARSASEWEEALNAVGVPAGRVRDLAEMLAEEHTAARKLTTPMDAMPGTTVHVPTAGFKANGAAIAPTTPAPRLGEHSREVLGELGLSDEDIDALVSGNIVGTADETGERTPASAAFARL
ncbi:MAG: CoA transferase, partial [Martelella sp.]